MSDIDKQDGQALEEIDVTIWATLSAESLVPRKRGEFIFYEGDLMRVVKSLIAQAEKEARVDELARVSKKMHYDSNDRFLDGELYTWIWEVRYNELRKEQDE